MIDLTALRSEIQNDPKALGFAGKSPAEVADLLNSNSGPGVGPIQRGRVPLDDPAIASMLAYALPRIETLQDQNRKDFYVLLVQTINAVGALYTSDPNVQAIVGQAVQEQIVTQQQAAAVAYRAGTRAEVLFGPGSRVDWTDVAAAMPQE